MIGRDAVAPLRPRPCGPPLRGRATLRDGITTGRPEGRHETGTGDSRLHLRNADPWSKIGGRRSGRPDLPHSAEIDRPTSVDLSEVKGLEGIDEFTELSDVNEGQRMPRPHQGLAAFGLEKVDLLRVNGNALPVLQVQQDAVFDDGHESSVRRPVVSAVKRGLDRLKGRFSG